MAAGPNSAGASDISEVGYLHLSEIRPEQKGQLGASLRKGNITTGSLRSEQKLKP